MLIIHGALAASTIAKTFKEHKATEVSMAKA